MWRRIRTFMQTDLLSPSSANGCVPGVAQAAPMASRGARESAYDVNFFLNHDACDTMFQTIMFVQLSSNLADSQTRSDPVDVEFCQLSVKYLALLIRMSNDKHELIKFNLDLETETYQKCKQAMDGVKGIVMQKLDAFKERMDRGELDEHERKSCFCRAINQQREEDTTVDEE